MVSLPIATSYTRRRLLKPLFSNSLKISKIFLCFLLEQQKAYNQTWCIYKLDDTSVGTYINFSNNVVLKALSLVN